MPDLNAAETPVLAALMEARQVMVLTGAGVSAASGVPTFRDALTGLWAKDDPMQLATPEAFADNPVKVAAWYEYRRGLVESCEPNPAHQAITQMQQAYEAMGGLLTLFTQNVDGLHERAKTRGVQRLHGTLLTWRCMNCGEKQGRSGLAVLDADQCPPVCDACEGLMRPDVVWFGEALPTEVLQAAEQAAQSCDVFLTIGTSGVVYPAAGLVKVAKQAGAMCVEINPNPSEPSGEIAYVIAEGAERCLPRWAKAMEAWA